MPVQPRDGVPVRVRTGRAGRRRGHDWTRRGRGQCTAPPPDTAAELRSRCGCLVPLASCGGSSIDAKAGRMTLQDYGKAWLRPVDPSTRRPDCSCTSIPTLGPTAPARCGRRSCRGGCVDSSRCRRRGTSASSSPGCRPLKGRKVRDVPLPESVAPELAAHLRRGRRWPWIAWEELTGAPRSVDPLLSTRETTAAAQLRADSGFMLRVRPPDAGIRGMDRTSRRPDLCGGALVDGSTGRAHEALCRLLPQVSEG